MVSFTAQIKKFGNQGEKTGWTYVTIPQELAQALKPDTKKSYRVKGNLDQHKVGGLALVPMGGGAFILPLNAELRKKIRKKEGDTLQLQLEEDTAVVQLPEDLLACLDDEPAAKAHFFSLPPSHRLYYGRWIDSAKTDATRTRRIAQAVNALAQAKDYGTMIREGKKEKGEGLG
jgi:uncharacterized protein YdeI (YjbR/CyaY-like superfamily)